MDENERRFLLEMKTTLKKYLTQINQRILDYQPDEDDHEHAFLLKKAVQYRDILRTINEKLNQDEEL